MNERQKKRIATQEANKQKREAIRARNEAEIVKNIAILKQVRDSQDSPLESRMEAVKMLADYARRGYSYLL